MALAIENPPAKNIQKKKKNHPREDNPAKSLKDDNMQRDTSVQIRLSSAQKEIWEKHAKIMDKSMTQFVIDAVEQYIRDESILDKIDTRFNEFNELLEKLDK